MSAYFLLISTLICHQLFAEKDSLGVISQMKLAKDQLAHIKQHGVLLRLQSYDKAREAYAKAGNIESLTRLEKMENESDARIIEAFKEHFTFTNVYYFKARDSDKIKNGDYSALYTLDGKPVNYTGKDLYIIDPYRIENDATKSSFSGFSLLNADNAPLKYPMPSTMSKRRGPFYKTYGQLVFDWNKQFLAMEELSRIISTMEKENTLNPSSEKYLKSERKRLFREYKHRKEGRPRPTNKE